MKKAKLGKEEQTTSVFGTEHDGTGSCLAAASVAHNRAQSGHYYIMTTTPLKGEKILTDD